MAGRSGGDPVGGQHYRSWRVGPYSGHDSLRGAGGYLRPDVRECICDGREDAYPERRPRTRRSGAALLDGDARRRATHDPDVGALQRLKSHAVSVEHSALRVLRYSQKGESRRALTRDGRGALNLAPGPRRWGEDGAKGKTSGSNGCGGRQSDKGAAVMATSWSQGVTRLQRSRRAIVAPTGQLRSAGTLDTERACGRIGVSLRGRRGTPAWRKHHSRENLPPCVFRAFGSDLQRDFASLGRRGTWVRPPGVAGTCEECTRSFEARVSPLVVEWDPESGTRLADVTDAGSPAISCSPSAPSTPSNRFLHGTPGRWKS